MKRAFVITALLLLSQVELRTAIAEESGVQAPTLRFYTTTNVQRSRRKEHPAKFLKCWGRDTEWSTDRDTVERSFTSPSGQNVQIVSGGGHDDIRDFVAQSVSWDVEFGADQVFRLNFAQNIATADAHGWATECNSTHTESNLVGIKNSFKAGAQIYVPQGVFVIRIKTLAKASDGSITASLSHDLDFAAAVKSRSDFRREIKANAVGPGIGEFSYFLVKPGDRLNFSVEYTSEQRVSAAYDVSYEIAMLGSFKCDETIGHPADAQLDHSQFLKRVRGDTSSEAGFHQFVAATSCLRRPDFIKELLLNNHGSQIATFIRELENVRNVDPGLSSHRDQEVAQFIAAAAVLDLTDTVLRDLKGYCSVKPLTVLFGDLPPDFSARVRGYHAAAKDFVKVAYLLERARAGYIDTLLAEAARHEQSALTYASAVKRTETREFLRQLQYSFRSDFRVFSSIRSVVKSLPETASGSRSREKILSQLETLESEANRLSNQMKSILLSYARSDARNVSVAQETQQWQVYQSQVKTLQALLQRDLDWFRLDETAGYRSNVSHSQFTRDMHFLAETVLNKTISHMKATPRVREIAERQANEASGYDFGALEALQNEVVECLDNPDGSDRP